MKQSDSTEIDRLLRRYARRNAEALPASDGLESVSTRDASGSAHMDADELNAYAEGALPEGARSRYFAHLADCETCRKLVTELTLASGALSEEKRVAVTKPSPSKSWREWLAAIFSPPVLRYAVPALALFGVIIVAVVVMRARREESFVAQNNESTSNSALRTAANSNSDKDASSANTTASAENHSNANMANSSSNTAVLQPGQQARNPTGVVSAPEQEKPAAVDQNAPAPPLAEAAKPAVGQTGVNDKKQGTFEAGKNSETIAGNTSPQPTPAPDLSATTSPAAGTDNSKREEQAKRKNLQKDDDETVVMDRGSTATTSKTAASEARRDRGRKASEPAAQGAGVRIAIAPKSETADTVAEKERASETRSVSGRQFRRKGNAWVDTAYNSSRSTINVARGSEQYRALVADEPGLRAITQQLGGEVIVVWKSHAYKFY